MNRRFVFALLVCSTITAGTLGFMLGGSVDLERQRRDFDEVLRQQRHAREILNEAAVIQEAAEATFSRAEAVRARADAILADVRDRQDQTEALFQKIRENARP